MNAAKASEFAGHTIELDSSHKFVVSGPLFEERGAYTRIFESYASACEAINKRVMTAAKEADTKLMLPVLKHDGSGETAIKGIHARLGNLLFTEPAYSKVANESYGGVDRVYLPEEWIKDLLIERELHQKRVLEIG